MKFWVTKYALSAGIIEVEGEISNTCDDMLVCQRVGVLASRSRYDEYFHGKDWHRTKVSAITRAEDMRVAKIASLEKQLKKLKGFRFDGLKPTE